MKMDTVAIPETVSMEIKNKIVTCKGALGELKKSFKKYHVQLIPKFDEKKRLCEVGIRVWFANKKDKACINSTKKHLQNMIVGVTKGFVSVMKYGFRFFPMTINVNKNNLEIIKFAGRLHKPVVKPVEGVKLEINPVATAKEIIVSGIDADSVGKTCGLINGICKYRNVDKRIFIDGIYMFEKKHIKN
jgi:ribosomal protein L6P/L9E